MIDEATGRQRAAVLAFLDWATEKVWGVEGEAPAVADLAEMAELYERARQ